ncbi:glycoside hydrolase family 1 protein [Yersinia ruckeri]|uniref:glycoside hydrolase family 1 protein n=1 Tax=Yersinia ruckeri TaxID=29486 RepID=UPI0011A00BC2|nr:glycoside hydrolase family 1 protein [Yersinia ruckeri]EKN3346556.1 glycoside hydrolase family 1 protein [Yersinia ruckeri]EKN3362657.1 glycoside hydrolase family 1 protein [Yersinia ruckeri]EKN4202654.1 glycoside hydrolase family 1 protein [Yersinia ruckeri]EKN4209596.1 glycoside hydrolase family 1 protein [Yersinia ruckeri]EKN4699342.1 glycoside hydrolase family 1 protein [Yersinia ruckeri]
MKYQFPDDFWWGSATSAAQSEGAALRDGKSKNIFDYWYEIAPERFHDRIGPENTSTFYDCYKQDILLLKALGHNTFRTSISWSRLIPTGDGELNPKAIAFYHALIDNLLANGITPFINLYHFDMPLCMQEKGGWENPAVVDAYARYAKTCFMLFGDRVKHWFTFNEPIVPVEAGYLNDLHYPCIVDFKRAVTVAYHCVLAHAKAVSAYRQLRQGGTIGIILNLSPTYPRSDSIEDQVAAHHADLLLNRSFLDPVTKGVYPDDLIALLRQHDLLPHIEASDAHLIASGTVDLLGVNYYQPRRIQAKETPVVIGQVKTPEDLFSFYFMPGRKINPHRGWEIYEKGLYDILKDLKENYGNIPCYISENGMGVEGEEQFIDATGMVDDDYRIDFIRDHLTWLHQAVQEGCNCKGYHLWTFIDCWSWLNAYKNRYGLVRLNMVDQTRTLKKSGYWFANVARQNGFN